MKESVMTSIARTENAAPASFLRRAVLADAALSGATGMMMMAGAGILEGLLSIPASLLLAAGLILVPYVAFVVFVGTRTEIPRGGVKLIIAANVLWTIASIALLVGGFIAPNLLGYAFVIGQAVVVALLGELQYVGLRRTV
jgi:hypothetical protein